MMPPYKSRTDAGVNKALAMPCPSCGAPVGLKCSAGPVCVERARQARWEEMCFFFAAIDNSAEALL